MKKEWYIYGVVTIILVVAVLFRCLDIYSLVFSEDGNVYLLGIDPSFYLRHVETAIRNFPALQVFDHATHYPGGIVSDSTGLYTWIMAAICRMVYGADATTREVSSFMAWVPVFFAAATYLMVYLIGVRLRHSIAAIFAMFLFLVYPGLSLSRGMLGFPDHHIVEVFLALWMVYNLLGIKSYLNGERNGFLNPALACIPYVLFFTAWSGAPLYFILAGMVLCLFLLVEKPENFKKVGTYSFIYLATAALFYQCIYWFVPDLLTSSFPKYQSYIGGMMIAGGTIVYILSVVLKKASFFINEKWLKPIAFIGMILSVGLFFQNTDIGREVLQRLSFKADGVAENKAINLNNFMVMLGLPGVISIVYMIYLGVLGVVGNLKNKADIVIIFLAGFFLYMWFNTFDMGYMIAPFVCIVAGIALYDLTAWAIYAEKKAGKYFKYPVMAIPYLVIFLCFIRPMVFYNPQYPYKMERLNTEGSLFYGPQWFDAMDWLKDHTPELTFPTDKIINRKEYTEGGGNEYGVLTAWDNGNVINQRGHRVPSWSRWPDNNNERLLIYHPDTLKNFILEKNVNFKYIAINASMASKYFMSKYAILGNDVFECLDKVAVNYNNQELLLNGVGKCYQNSLIYKTFVEADTSIHWIKEVYRSPEQSLIGYTQSGNNLIIQEIPADGFSPEQMGSILGLGYMNLNNTLFYNLSLRPSLMIFEIVPEFIPGYISDI